MHYIYLLATSHFVQFADFVVVEALGLFSPHYSLPGSAGSNLRHSQPPEFWEFVEFAVEFDFVTKDL